MDNGEIVHGEWKHWKSWFFKFYLIFHEIKTKHFRNTYRNLCINGELKSNLSMQNLEVLLSIFKVVHAAKIFSLPRVKSPLGCPLIRQCSPWQSGLLTFLRFPSVLIRHWLSCYLRLRSVYDQLLGPTLNATTTQLEISKFLICNMRKRRLLRPHIEAKIS